MEETPAPAPGTFVLRLPALVGGRGLADQLLDRLSPSYRGARVVVDASQTSSGTASFASQVVTHVLREGGAASLTVVGAPSRFNDQFRAAAEQAGVAARLALAASMRAAEVRDLAPARP